MRRDEERKKEMAGVSERMGRSEGLSERVGRSEGELEGLKGWKAQQERLLQDMLHRITPLEQQQVCSFVNLFAPSFVRSFVRSFIHSFVHSLFVHSLFVHSFVYSFICLLLYLFVHLLVRSFVCLFVRSHVCSFVWRAFNDWQERRGQKLEGPAEEVLCYMNDSIRPILSVLFLSLLSALSLFLLISSSNHISISVI